MENTDFRQWDGFKGEAWRCGISVKDFIKSNFTPYGGYGSFLKGATDRTKGLMDKLNALLKNEADKGGVLDIDTHTVSSLLTYEAGYLDKENEIIVGLQTDAPLKRGVHPFGGIRMARAACEAYGYKLGEEIEEHFKFRTTHNDGVFRVYSDEMKTVRHIGIITGLPDAYGRGRIIGDYRRVALYGVDLLIAGKEEDKKRTGDNLMDADNIRLNEELYQQIAFLNKLKEMAKMYGCDIAQPAANAYEAVQWTYFAYLGAIKEQNGAAMSLGRVSSFIDIYIERDLQRGIIDEVAAQELIDDFVMKLRMARILRTADYNELFGGDPMWITESIGGVTNEGVALVTKSSFRMLQTLYNLGSSAEPNLTVLWSEKLPRPFKEFCAKVSIDTDSIQYENDDIMRLNSGDDYAIACCVSAMRLGEQMQFFGARCNLPKLLLLALNGGYDNVSRVRVGPQMPPVNADTATGVLDYGEVAERFKIYKEWLCALYVNTMNVIHYMHDKYAYEKTQMALHDTNVERLMAFGVAGLSVITDSLSAIKFAKIRPITDTDGYITDFSVEGDFPKFGNDDERVDDIACELLTGISGQLKRTPTYRNAQHTLSVLTITSNVVYGKKTGATPDGRECGAPFASGANPMHNRETRGALASLNSVAKLPYQCCLDGISNTFSIVPQTLGKDEKSRVENLVDIMNGYFSNGAHHLNVNVLNREKLLEAYEDPQRYPNLTIRVSGYAVNFHKLSKEQQREVINRTFHVKL